MIANVRFDLAIVVFVSACHLTEAISVASAKRWPVLVAGDDQSLADAVRNETLLGDAEIGASLLRNGSWRGKVLAWLKEEGHLQAVEPPSNQYEVLPVTFHQRRLLEAMLAIAIALDFMVLHRFSGTTVSHFALLAFWILMAAVFGEVVSYFAGSGFGVMWAESYVLDWMLSLDNLFAFHVIFVAFKTPFVLQQKVLSYWLILSVVLRSVFYRALEEALTISPVFRYACGLFLLYTAYVVVVDDEDNLEVHDLAILRFLKWLFGERLDSRYDEQEGKFFFWGGDCVKASLMVIVLLLVVFIDMVYAIDSIGAKVAAIPNTFVGWSSSILFLLASRPAFFLLEDAVETFDLLKYGIAAILMLLGVEFLLSDYVEVKPQESVQMFSLVFAVCITGSLVQKYFPFPSKTMDEDPAEGRAERAA